MNDISRAVDAYIAQFPEAAQDILQQVRAVIREAAPQAEETMRYGIPTFTLRGNLVHFAGYKKHIGFYPTPSAIEHFKGALGAYKLSKGAVQFPLDQPIPYTLIREIVQFRVSEKLAQPASGK